MTSRLTYLFTRFCRLPRSRGFGVQSPWAYRFVRSVVSERRPYYAYLDHKEHLQSLPKSCRRICRFMVRLANFVQAKVWISLGSDVEMYERYIHAGCVGSEISHTASAVDGLTADDAWAVLVSATDNDAVVQALQLMKQADEKCLLVVDNIRRDKAARQTWRQLKSQIPSTVVFDMHDCAVMFFHTVNHRQTYAVRLP